MFLLLFFIPTAPDAAPTNLAVLNVTSTSVSVMWEAPPTELQNGVIRHYQVTAFEVDTGQTVTLRATASTAFTVGELHPYYTYRISVAAVTVATGPLSIPISALTLQDGELSPQIPSQLISIYCLHSLLAGILINTWQRAPCTNSCPG